MTDQTQIAPVRAALPDFGETQEKLSVSMRMWLFISAPLPRSARMRRDLGLDAGDARYDPQDHATDIASRHGLSM